MAASAREPLYLGGIVNADISPLAVAQFTVYQQLAHKKKLLVFLEILMNLFLLGYS